MHVINQYQHLSLSFVFPTNFRISFFLLSFLTAFVSFSGGVCCCCFFSLFFVFRFNYYFILISSVNSASMAIWQQWILLVLCRRKNDDDPGYSGCRSILDFQVQNVLYCCWCAHGHHHWLCSILDLD